MGGRGDERKGVGVYSTALASIHCICHACSSCSSQWYCSSTSSRPYHKKKYTSVVKLIMWAGPASQLSNRKSVQASMQLSTTGHEQWDFQMLSHAVPHCNIYVAHLLILLSAMQPKAVHIHVHMYVHETKCQCNL